MLLQTRHLSKAFNGAYALKDIDFSLDAGEIHGLVGENGAGKSTLIKILTGVYSADAGEVLWNGQPLPLRNPSEIRRAGISVIHQERTLIPSFSCTENAWLGLPYPTRHGRVDWKQMRDQVQEKADTLGISLDPDKTAGELSPPQRTCLEIVRAMMHDCRLLILDEPTASLTNRETDLLFRIIDQLRCRGASVLYVTHRMEEIFHLTDRVTVFKNGENVATLETGRTNQAALIELMTDQWHSGELHKGRQGGKILLKAEHLRSRDGMVRDASLEVRAGEILGIFGLGGSGRTELLECLYGVRPLSGGKITFLDQVLEHPVPDRSIQMGITLISEDRRGKAMIGNLSVRENTALSCLQQFTSGGVVSGKKEKKAVLEMLSRLQVRMVGPEQRAMELSGGNQQKMVFARAMMTHPRLFLCDEPTQAVDVKTRAEIHRILREQAEEGCGVIFVSSDLKEILEVSDRIQILVGGETQELLDNQGLSSQQILAKCYRERAGGSMER